MGKVWRENFNCFDVLPFFIVGGFRAMYIMYGFDVDITQH